MLNTQGLSLDQAPPIGVPFRFFLTAPLFAVAAGVLLAYGGPAVFVSRWSPQALALTHLITIGFLAQVMVGAMMQMLPVLAGARVPAAAAASSGIHLALNLGTLVLAGGFLGAGGTWLVIGALMLALAFTLFLVVAGIALVRAPGAPDAVRAMRLGLLALVPTVVLGLLLALGLAGWRPVVELYRVVELHLVWGLLGWVGLLLLGILAELVPMFYVTPAFPGVLRKWLAPGVFLFLALWALPLPGPNRALLGAAIAGFVLMALVAVRLIHERKRPIHDATLFYIWVGCAALVAAAVAWVLSADAVCIGVLLLAGVALAFPGGMLNKIVPFLCWFHLQGAQLAAGRFDRTLPTMKGFIPEQRARSQLWLYLAALASLLAGCLWPEPWSRIGGFLLALASLLLWVNLVAAVRRFVGERRAMEIG